MLSPEDFEMFSLKGLYWFINLSDPLKPQLEWTTKCIKEVRCYSQKVIFSFKGFDTTSTCKELIKAIGLTDATCI